MDELKILNIYERIFLRKAKFMFKVSKSVLPSYVNEMFSFRPFKGDISRFFIFHCKSLLYVGFYVFIKNPDHFPQCLVIKSV